MTLGQTLIAIQQAFETFKKHAEAIIASSRYVEGKIAEIEKRLKSIERIIEKEAKK